jgi:hypothetical protein
LCLAWGEFDRGAIDPFDRERLGALLGRLELTRAQPIQRPLGIERLLQPDKRLGPGARLLGGPWGALPQSAADAALIPGAARTGLTPEGGALG